MVQKFLDKALIVIDPLAITVDLQLSFLHRNNTVRIIYKDKLLESISGVWYRKPTPLSHIRNVSPAVSRNYSEDALRQYSELIKGQFPTARWISDYYAIKRASNKSLGLYAARNLGLATPDTLFTSDWHQAKQFVAQYSEVIVKPLSRFFPLNTERQPTMFFATKITAHRPIDLSGLNLAPAIFQQAIDTAYDVRVNVVGSQAFASKVTNPGLTDSPVRDWRIGHFTDTINFEAYPQLPRGITDKCIALTKKLGLLYGAIDLVRDKKGRYWFLEINPNGQWAFVDEPSVKHIGQAIAHLLSKKL